jgi:hypothetical protein
MKKFSSIKKFILLGIVTAANFAEAAVCGTAGGGGVEQMLFWGQCILNAVVPVLVSAAMVGFIYGVIEYYINPANEEKRKKGKSFIVGGLFALFVIIAMWGLVAVLTNTFGVSNVIPQLPSVGGTSTT